MAFDAFLKIEMTGDKSEQVEFQLEGFNFGVSNPGTVGSSTGGAGSGKVSLQDFSFSAVVGKQSPQLFDAAVNGREISSAVLTVTDKVQVMMVTFSTILISNYKLDEGGLFTQKFSEGGLPAVQLGAPMENVSFNFMDITFQVGSSLGKGSVGNNGAL
jgi:type VI secretion system secreted protein Hcp